MTPSSTPDNGFSRRVLEIRIAVAKCREFVSRGQTAHVVCHSSIAGCFVATRGVALKIEVAAALKDRDLPAVRTLVAGDVFLDSDADVNFNCDFVGALLITLWTLHKKIEPAPALRPLSANSRLNAAASIRPGFICFAG